MKSHEPNRFKIMEDAKAFCSCLPVIIKIVEILVTRTVSLIEF